MAKKDEVPRIEVLKDKSRDAVRYAREKYEDARSKTEDFVREKPFTSVAIAAAVGAAMAIGVMVLVSRRKKSFWDNLRDMF